MTTIRLTGVGEVSLEELEARLSAYVNAGAPRPRLEGSREDQERILRSIAARGDAQMRRLVDSLLSE